MKKLKKHSVIITLLPSNGCDNDENVGERMLQKLKKIGIEKYSRNFVLLLFKKISLIKASIIQSPSFPFYALQ